jgi:hypothetical protein
VAISIVVHLAGNCRPAHGTSASVYLTGNCRPVVGVCAVSLVAERYGPVHIFGSKTFSVRRFVYNLHCPLCSLYVPLRPIQSKSAVNNNNNNNNNKIIIVTFRPESICDFTSIFHGVPLVPRKILIHF